MYQALEKVFLKPKVIYNESHAEAQWCHAADPWDPTLAPMEQGKGLLVWTGITQRCWAIKGLSIDLAAGEELKAQSLYSWFLPPW